MTDVALRFGSCCCYNKHSTSIYKNDGVTSKTSRKMDELGKLVKKRKESLGKIQSFVTFAFAIMIAPHLLNIALLFSCALFFYAQKES